SRGLIINDVDITKDILLRENYFFVNGYRHPFLENENKYKKGTTFEEVYSLFLFDRSLRNIIFKYLLIVENNIKSILSYQLSKKYGYRESDYLKTKTFDNKPNKLRQIEDLINKMKRQVRINGFQHSATRHYMYNYGYVPLWILVKVLSFGIVSEMYSILKIEDRIEIAKNFNVSAEDLSIYLPLLSNYRNLCAHEDILYENKTQRMINDTVYHKMLGIDQVDSEYVLGKNDIFSLIIILKRILREEDFKNMMSELENKINTLAYNLKTIDISIIRDILGFPNNWLDLINLEEDGEEYE
ncbi:MAG: Abi family protein, partial [Clostridiales bacterium]|nr:Abi family protein [Clostridiales bacterium]